MKRSDIRARRPHRAALGGLAAAPEEQHEQDREDGRADEQVPRARNRARKSVRRQAPASQASDHVATRAKSLRRAASARDRRQRLRKRDHAARTARS